MPVFDVIKINQSHIAKVMVERQNRPEPTNDEIVSVGNFNRWMNYIRRELKKGTTLSTNIEYVMN